MTKEEAMIETRIVEYGNAWEASSYDLNSESIAAMILRGWTFGEFQAGKDGRLFVVFHRPTTEQALVSRCYEYKAPFEACGSMDRSCVSYSVRDTRSGYTIQSHIASAEEAKACAEKLNKEWVDKEVNKYFARQEDKV